MHHLESDIVKLLSWAFVAIDRIVDASCANYITGASTQLGPLSFGTLSFSVEAITSKKVALMIAQWLARYIARLAKAYLLSDGMVVDITVATVHLAKRNPEVVLTILGAFGEAGEALRTLKDFSAREYLMLVHKGLVQRIDQIERAGLGNDIEAKVRAAARKAKSRAEIPQAIYDHEVTASQKTSKHRVKDLLSTFVRNIKGLIRFS